MPITSHNQPNHEEIIRQENDINTTERNAQAPSRLQNEIGSKVLALVNFESKHKDIVESSFNKARNNKEKLPGKNNECRNFAYLSRLNNMVEKYGNKAEQKIWEASAENVVMDYEDIPEAYWKQQEQILRDNGQGRKLSEYEKKILAEDLIDKQRQSITSWANYLGDKNCPYPLWFKVYAFDGISKMSNALNLDDADYNRRDNTTALSFPKLNAEILAKVYRQINDFYGIDKENWLSKHSDDEKLVSLVKTANFPKLYAKELVDTKVIIKTPERTEDVHGDWFEYKLGDEEEIASLAEGTRWCVADPNVAHNYLTYGQYNDPGEDNDYDDEDIDDYNYDNYEDEDWGDDNREEGYDHDDIEVENPEAKFIIFRLKDPNSPGVFASNGSASIRLDPDGKVAEISGIGSGQSVEDALIPILKEKTLSLPGGKKYLQKFNDKQELIKLDKKREKDEDLSLEELNFIYETNRPIAMLDSYQTDPRLGELKEKYDLNYALEKGVNIHKVLKASDEGFISKNIKTFLNHGIEAQEITKLLSTSDIVSNLDILIKHHADIDVDKLIEEVSTFSLGEKAIPFIIYSKNRDNLVNELGSETKLVCLDILTKYGYNFDPKELYQDCYNPYSYENIDAALSHGVGVNTIIQRLKPREILEKFDYLNNHGADLNINQLLPELDDNSYYLHAEFLFSKGVDIQLITDHLEEDGLLRNSAFLLSNGVDPNKVVKGLGYYPEQKDIDLFLSYNVDIDQIESNLRPKHLTRYINYLIDKGVDLTKCAKNLESDYIANNINKLLSHGVDINEIAQSLDSRDLSNRIGMLINRGVDTNPLVDRLSSEALEENLDGLLSSGININRIIKRVGSDFIDHELDKLLANQADISIITDRLDTEGLYKNIDKLMAHNADINKIINNVDPWTITDHIDTLITHGAKIKDIVKLTPETKIQENLQLFVSSGADINLLIEEMDLYDRGKNLDYLLSQGADINRLCDNLHSADIGNNLNSLLEYGADPNNLLKHLSINYIGKNLSLLLENGLNIENVLKRINNSDSLETILDSLLENNIDVNTILSKVNFSRLDESDDAKNYHSTSIINTLLSQGVKIGELVSHLSSPFVEHNLDLLISQGANINELTKKLSDNTIDANLERFYNLGLDSNTIINRLNKNNISKNIDFLLSHGVDINRIINEIDYDTFSFSVYTLLSHKADLQMVINRLDYHSFMINLATLKDYGLTVDGVYKRISEYSRINTDTNFFYKWMRKAGFDV